MEILEVKNVTYTYPVDENTRNTALDNVSLTVHRGEFLCILGHNGSGKSTLAKLMNSLLLPEKGSVYILGNDTMEEKELWKLRRHAGMVFQNPDNQIVSSIVEEDVAFGPENLGMSRDEIISCVSRALKAVGMTGYEKRSPAMLSGGQKQRVAIAGVLAMLPDVIIFDEPTAMLDPSGRREVLDTIHTLNRKLGKTIVYITHFMEEAVEADRIVVMKNGKIILDGTPSCVFSDREAVVSAGLSLPEPAQLYFDLKDRGIELGSCPVTKEEIAEELCRLF